MIIDTLRAVFKRIFEPLLKRFRRVPIVYRTSKGMYYSTMDKKNKRTYFEVRVWIYHTEKDKYSEEDCDEKIVEILSMPQFIYGSKMALEDFALELSKKVEIDEIPEIVREQLDVWYGFVVFVHRELVDNVLEPVAYYWYVLREWEKEFRIVESGVASTEEEIGEQISEVFKWFKVGE